MPNDIISPPPKRITVDTGAAVSRPWSAWFEQVFTMLFAAGQSGTTANRPTEGLWIGRPYFDTTLGYAIWYDGTQWVDATGAAV